MPEQPRRSDGELSPFDIADWLWSFRWLAAALFLCAAIWTAFLFWGGRGGGSVENTRYQVAINIFTAGTPVRRASEIADIYGAQLVRPGLSLISVAGENPVTLQADSRSLADAAVAESTQIAERLVADVQTQAETLAPYMQREDVPEFIVEQYIGDISFLAGVEAGLITIARPEIQEMAKPANTNVRLVLPWIACGVLFLALAGVATFVARWRTHRLRVKS